ncbi:hypothetical protein L798_13690 [Zootermopsis nevadensis]|uniref:Uncharacterized protein n=2 Tax=Zootermopsis nevadensis TaxID=136037 RepID=A0A067R242_ZOONE|nr:hypothetical protein L798_13690 [Zootermopsis nevadensis]
MRSQVLCLQESLVSGDVIMQGGVPHLARLNITAPEELVPILRSPFTNESVREDDVIVGKCSYVPSTLVTDILYTTVPDRSPEGLSIYRIVGVRVRFQTEDWTFDASAFRQMMTLTSVVTFLPVPLVDEKPQSRFWQLMTAPDESETAWLNILQILDHFTTGDEIVEMSACGIVLAALALSLSFLHRKDL